MSEGSGKYPDENETARAWTVNRSSRLKCRVSRLWTGVQLPDCGRALSLMPHSHCYANVFLGGFSERTVVVSKVTTTA